MVSADLPGDTKWRIVYLKDIYQISSCAALTFQETLLFMEKHPQSHCPSLPGCPGHWNPQTIALCLGKDVSPALLWLLQQRWKGTNLYSVLNSRGAWFVFLFICCFFLVCWWHKSHWALSPCHHLISQLLLSIATGLGTAQLAQNQMPAQVEMEDLLCFPPRLFGKV